MKSKIVCKKEGKTAEGGASLLWPEHRRLMIQHGPDSSVLEPLTDLNGRSMFVSKRHRMFRICKFCQRPGAAG
jgi:hypothetical protein